MRHTSCVLYIICRVEASICFVESVEQQMLGRCRTPEVRIVGLELAHAGVRSGFQAPRQSAFAAKKPQICRWGAV
jgi:hypothetical protein